MSSTSDQQWQFNLSVMLDKDRLDVLVATALAEAGLNLSQRMAYGPTISNSLLRQSSESEVANKLFKVKVQSIVFE